MIEAEAPELPFAAAALRRPKLARYAAARMLAARLAVGRMHLVGAGANADTVEKGRVQVHRYSMGSRGPPGKTIAGVARADLGGAWHAGDSRRGRTGALKKEAARRRPKSREETPKEGSKAKTQS
jgi:hypothetical protein